MLRSVAIGRKRRGLWHTQENEQDMPGPISQCAGEKKSGHDQNAWHSPFLNDTCSSLPFEGRVQVPCRSWGHHGIYGGTVVSKDLERQELQRALFLFCEGNGPTGKSSPESGAAPGLYAVVSGKQGRLIPTGTL